MKKFGTYLVYVFSAKKKKVNFWVTYNFSLSPWIPSKLDSSHSHYVYIQPCENGQNLRKQKISSTLVFSLKSHSEV